MPSKDYQAYLQSEKWKATARDAKVSVGGRCQGCDRKTWTLHVHHLTYERLGTEKATDLWVVCPSCHLKFHPHHKKAVNKQRKKQGKPKIRGTLGIKPQRRVKPPVLRVTHKAKKGARPWSPEERERLLKEADERIKSRQ